MREIVSVHVGQAGIGTVDCDRLQRWKLDQLVIIFFFYFGYGGFDPRVV